MFQVSAGFQGYSRCFQGSCCTFLPSQSTVTLLLCISVSPLCHSACTCHKSLFSGQFKADHTYLSSFKPPLFSPKWFPLSLTGFILLPAHMNLIHRLFCQFVSSLSSLFSLLPPCPQITRWSQTAEGCRSSSRPATSSREPAAPGWWSSCRGCGDSSSSCSSSGSVTGCCCWGSPVGGEAGRSGMTAGFQPLLMLRSPWKQYKTILIQTSVSINTRVCWSFYTFQYAALKVLKDDVFWASYFHFF